MPTAESVNIFYDLWIFSCVYQDYGLDTGDHNLKAHPILAIKLHVFSPTSPSPYAHAHICSYYSRTCIESEAHSMTIAIQAQQSHAP